MRIQDTITDTIYTTEKALYEAYPVEHHKIIDRIIKGTATADEWHFLALKEAEPEISDDARELQQALIKGAHSQREAYPPYPAIPAHTVGDIQIFVNPELKGGGLNEWRKNKNIWFTLTAPDGAEVQADYKLGSWEALDIAVAVAQRDWEERVYKVSKEAEEASRHVAKIEAELAEARTAREATIRALSDTGVSNYRIAKVTGLTQPTVARILKKMGK